MGWLKVGSLCSLASSCPHDGGMLGSGCGYGTQGARWQRRGGWVTRFTLSDMIGCEGYRYRLLGQQAPEGPVRQGGAW
jgi:hypothetical protein